MIQAGHPTRDVKVHQVVAKQWIIIGQSKSGKENIVLSSLPDLLYIQSTYEPFAVFIGTVATAGAVSLTG